MEMHQIRYFLAVARTLNFTEAADECHVSQPSLSRAIIKLEEELGGDLFRRERGLTHLTDLGRMMQPLLQQTFDAASSAKTLASSYRKGGTAPLRLAISETINMRVLLEPLAGLTEALPGLELKFFRGTAGEVAEHIKTGGSELGIAGPLAESWDRFKSWNLFARTFRLLVHKSHRLANNRSIAIRDLDGERLFGRPYCEVADRFAALLAANGIHQASYDTLASDADALELIGANLGVGILPATSPRQGNVKSLAFEGVDIECPTMLHAVQGRQHSPAAAGFIQLVRAANWRKIVDALIADAAAA
jgi:DNA-binding transcriptional LysR family regulator